MKTRILLASMLLIYTSDSLAQDKSEYYLQEYKAAVMTTDFILPVMRFNRLIKEGHPRGTLSAFNSLGAGLTFSYGRLDVRYKDKSLTEILKDEPLDYSNLVGLQIGFLFAINSATEENVSFAPTVAFSILDFSLGWGYEWGTLASDHEGHFFTLSYNVPMRKLFNKGLLVFYKDKVAKDRVIHLAR